MNENVLLCLGAASAIIGALLFLALLIAGLVIGVNRLTWMLLDCYGGIETFREFRHWYHNHREKSK